MSLSCKQLLAFVIAHARIRTITGRETLGGCNAKVVPATYSTDERAPITRYAVEERIIIDGKGDKIWTAQSVALKTVAVQGHALSAALLSVFEAGDVDLTVAGTDLTRICFRMGGSRR